ncbi:hypothetical protein [Xanthomonas sp. CFBP 8445]|uniref:hypothetical protein n=1 Tax=Xanthomonas sp. CFBP 8445 TaxID=2971236 RepID=UPI0021E01D59|nr:hypothetical protein [Xanthomonas sp. CFBP 8445]UYC12338.1 hypothetical protein NUG21_00850 [Xanthomonas sp. CFBP 8445]
MKLRNLSRWDLSERTNGLLFFAQRVDELLFDLSLDTYKPPALNAPHLCIEALALIKEIEKGFIDASNLQHVIEELTWSLQNDPIAKKLLDAEVSYYVIHNAQTPLSTTKLRLEVLARTINSKRYLKILREELFSAVTNCKKREIDFLATTLITTLTNNGLDKQWLHDKTHDFFFSPVGNTIDSPEHLLEFLDIADQSKHNFKIYVVVSNLIKQVTASLHAFRIKLLEDELPEQISQALLSTPLASNEVVILLEDFDARDPYSARHLAFRTLDRLGDLFTLFHHRKRITWRADVVAEWSCCAFAPVVCGSSRGPMEKAFDMREDRAAKELNRVINSLGLRHNSDSFQRFNRVADLHGICVEHDIPENQLVNLWTALETLIPSHVDGGSKIKQVINAAIPFIGITYIRRILDRLLFDLLIWDKWRTRKILNRVNTNKGADLTERLSIFLLDSTYAELRNELQPKLGDFHLLRYRIFSISNELATPDKVINRLDRHEKKVRWQLRRLYRARNLIVHTSQSPSYVNTLIENGHDYLDSITFELIRAACSDYQMRTIEQTFELTSIAYRKFRESIKNAPDFSDGRATILGRIKYQ